MTNVNYMKEYLSYALEFEKYVYIWSNAMNTANSQMRNIYKNRERLQETIASYTGGERSLKDPFTQQKIIKSKEAVSCRKKSKTAFTVLAVMVVLIFLFATIVSFSVLSPDFGFENQLLRVIISPLVGIVSALLISTISGVLPVCLFIHFSNKKKAEALEKEAKGTAAGGSERRQSMIRDSKIAEARSNLELNKKQEMVLVARQEEIRASLVSAQKSLQNIYSTNVLPQKYRNLTAVATMYEYLESRRCNTIEGHGGIYDTYDTERIQLEQLRNLISMNRKLDRIEDNQRYIVRQLSVANQALRNISGSLSQLEKTTAEIEKNTAISAVANQQTAEAARYVAWNQWARGN